MTIDAVFYKPSAWPWSTFLWDVNTVSSSGNQRAWNILPTYKMLALYIVQEFIIKVEHLEGLSKGLIINCKC